MALKASGKLDLIIAVGLDDRSGHDFVINVIDNIEINYPAHVTIKRAWRETVDSFPQRSSPKRPSAATDAP